MAADPLAQLGQRRVDGQQIVGSVAQDRGAIRDAPGLGAEHQQRDVGAVPPDLLDHPEGAAQALAGLHDHDRRAGIVAHRLRQPQRRGVVHDLEGAAQPQVEIGEQPGVLTDVEDLDRAVGIVDLHQADPVLHAGGQAEGAPGERRILVDAEDAPMLGVPRLRAQGVPAEGGALQLAREPVGPILAFGQDPGDDGAMLFEQRGLQRLQGLPQLHVGADVHRLVEEDRAVDGTVVRLAPQILEQVLLHRRIADPLAEPSLVGEHDELVAVEDPREGEGEPFRLEQHRLGILGGQQQDDLAVLDARLRHLERQQVSILAGLRLEEVALLEAEAARALVQEPKARGNEAVVGRDVGGAVRDGFQRSSESTM